MEFEVRIVGDIENCFVSLPLILIQTLQSTRSGLPLPQLLTLELRSSNRDRWVVSWSGATSASSSIEVARQFADCISLADRTFVEVRVVSDVPKATLVTIEPLTEDDWEVLELNSELAEAAMLNQVRIIHEAMRLPLWLHGRTVITFLVISTFPKNAVVQLAPGTEVAVAPKRRKNSANQTDDSDIQYSSKRNNITRALLRLQDSDGRFFHQRHIKGFEVEVALTSVAFINPETAKAYSLDPLQLVSIVPRLSSKEASKDPENSALKMKINASSNEVNGHNLADKREGCQVIIRLLISDSVAKGHIMIAQSLRHYLKAGLHSWIYLKGCGFDLKRYIPMLSLSPLHFKKLGKDKTVENGPGILDISDSHMRDSMLTRKSSGTYMNVVDGSTQDEILSALSCELFCRKDEDIDYRFDSKRGLKLLVETWMLAQLDSVATHLGREVKTLVLSNQTFLHFKVNGYEVGDNRKSARSCHGSLINKSRELQEDLFYVLTIFDESLPGQKVNAYEFTFDESDDHPLQLLEKMNLREPISFRPVKERTYWSGISSRVSSLNWMGTNASDVLNRIKVLISPASGLWFSSYCLPLPGHVLICGPPGSGKTLLSRAVAKSLEEHEDLLAHIVFVCCSRLALEKGPTIQHVLSGFISEALDHAPSVIIFDDLDSIVSSSSTPEGSQSSTTVTAITKLLVDIIEECEEKRKSSCGVGPVAFVASAQSLEKIPKALTSSGRFDFHVQLPAPAVSERKAILEHEIQRRFLKCSEEILQDVASKCDGYDAYDLEILVDRAVHAAVIRFLPSDCGGGKHVKPTLLRDEFSKAMHEFTPVAMRDVTKTSPEGGRFGWDDVGGLSDIRNAINEMIELPSKFPNIFAQAPLRLRSNVLLYGPPGCGKTHIVGAAAAACSLRFISVKGPELLNKYIGASEQAVRDIFAKATAAAPCLLFFDEFDSIAPKRGHDNTGVTDRVVNQFLTELDGVEVLTGVFVFAATSRPDLLDAALLRPGRLDRLLFCDFPSACERLDILRVLSRKLPLAGNVDLEIIAHMTEGFSGADLQALLSDAQLEAVHELLNDTNSSTEPGKKPIITDALLKSIASKARPSVSESEKHRLYAIYNQFLDSKRSASAQSRDSKGKRATLA